MTGAAEGNEIERSSENVLAIYTDSELKRNMHAKIQIIKGRNCGEMDRPMLISVNPKYYIVSDYDEEQENNSDNNIIDVNNIKNSDEDNNKEISFDISSEKEEELKKLGVNLTNDFA